MAQKIELIKQDDQLIYTHKIKLEKGLLLLNQRPSMFV